MIRALHTDGGQASEDGKNQSRGAAEIRENQNSGAAEDGDRRHKEYTAGKL